MGYVVYHRDTFVKLFGSKIFPTIRGARIALSRHCNKDGKNVDDYLVSDYATYDSSVPMVERINLMTGEKYMEKMNTPSYLSPACESYWSR